jgi:hypothetical protein
VDDYQDASPQRFGGGGVESEYPLSARYQEPDASSHNEEERSDREPCPDRERSIFADREGGEERGWRSTRRSTGACTVLDVREGVQLLVPTLLANRCRVNVFLAYSEVGESELLKQTRDTFHLGIVEVPP